MNLELIKQWQKYLPIQTHSDFQIKHFVIGGEGYNSYGMFIQAIREIITRINTIQLDVLDYKKEEIELEKLLDKLNNIDDKYDKQQTQIDIEKQKIKLQNLQNTILSKYAELKKFYKIAEYLYSQLRDKDIKQLEEDYWKKRLTTIFKLGDLSPDKKSSIKALLSMGETDILKEVDDDIATYLKQLNFKPLEIELTSYNPTLKELNQFLQSLPALTKGDDK